MDKRLLFVFLIGCLAAVLGTPPPGMYGMGDDGYSGGGGIMTRPMGGGYTMPMGGIGMEGGMSGMYGPSGGGYGSYGGSGYGGFGRFGGFGRPRYCKCRKHCRRWERYMGKCWHCRWWRCRVRCCRY